MQWKPGKDLERYYNAGLVNDVLPYDLEVAFENTDSLAEYNQYISLRVLTQDGAELAVCKETLPAMQRGSTLTLRGLHILLPLTITYV